MKGGNLANTAVAHAITGNDAAREHHAPEAAVGLVSNNDIFYWSAASICAVKEELCVFVDAGKLLCCKGPRNEA